MTNERFMEAVIRNNIEEVKRMLVADRQIAKNAEYLFTAVSLDYVEIVDLLLKNKAKVNAKDDGDYKRTALLKTLNRGNPNMEIIKLLLDYGANVNAKDSKKKRTPLIAAASAGNKQIVWWLLERGAKREHVDQNGYGETALEYAQQAGHTEVCDLIKHWDAVVQQKELDGLIDVQPNQSLNTI